MIYKLAIMGWFRISQDQMRHVDMGYIDISALVKNIAINGINHTPMQFQICQFI